METVSALGTGKVYAIIMAVSYNIVPKYACLYLWCGIVFANYTMNQLKSLYGEPRPYWVSDQIEANHCGTGFGNPSGHMLNNCFFWVTAYLHFFNGRRSNQQDERSLSRSPLFKFIILISMGAFLALMALSRVYLGAHTLNEVLHGTLIGSTMAIIGH